MSKYIDILLKTSLQYCFIAFNTKLVAHWERSRLIRQWSGFESGIYHTGNADDRQGHCVYCKIPGQNGKPPPEAKKRFTF